MNVVGILIYISSWKEERACLADKVEQWQPVAGSSTPSKSTCQNSLRRSGPMICLLFIMCTMILLAASCKQRACPSVRRRKTLANWPLSATHIFCHFELNCQKVLKRVVHVYKGDIFVTFLAMKIFLRVVLLLG